MVLLTFFCDGEFGFSTVGVSAGRGSRCEIQVQNCVALLPRNEMTGFHYRNWILGT